MNAKTRPLSQNSTNQIDQIDSFDEYIDYLANNNDSREVLQMFSIFFSKQNKSMDYPFIPMEQSSQFLCDTCQNNYSKFVILIPCGHKICEECINESNWDKIICPVCQISIQNIELDQNIAQKQLDTIVHCCNLESSEVNICSYLKKPYDMKDNKLLEVKKQFEQREIKVKYLNYLRSDKLTELNIRQIKLQQTIELYEYILKDNIQFIDQCEWQGSYEQLYLHIINDCPQTCIQCQYCLDKFPRKYIHDHEVLCPFKQKTCPLCLKLFQEHELCHHIIDCMDLLHYYSLNSYIIPDKFNFDYELDDQIQRIQQGIRNLQIQILRLDTLSQREVTAYKKAYQPQTNIKLTRNIQNVKFFNLLYEKNVLIFAILLQLVFVSFLEICNFYFSLYIHYISVPVIIIQVFNLFFLFLYTMQFIQTNRFRSSLALYMLNVYYVAILDFTGLYLAAHLISPETFNDRPYQIVGSFFNYLYFSSMVGSSIGFGDIYPKNIFVRYTAVVEIIFTQLVQKIVFRGFSFFFKLKEVERQHRKYKEEIDYNDPIEVRKFE